MYKSSDIREPRYKVIILAAPIVPLSRGLTVYVHQPQGDQGGVF